MDWSCVTYASILMVTNKITKKYFQFRNPDSQFPFLLSLFFEEVVANFCEKTVKIQGTVNVSHFELVELIAKAT